MRTWPDCPPRWTSSAVLRWPLWPACWSWCAGVWPCLWAGRMRCGASVLCLPDTRHPVPGRRRRRRTCSVEEGETRAGPAWTGPLWSQCKIHHGSDGEDHKHFYSYTLKLNTYSKYHKYIYNISVTTMYIIILYLYITCMYYYNDYNTNTTNKYIHTII